MYLLPSISVTIAPSASLMKTGVPPTALNARTGELTPPGITFLAFANEASELAMERRAAGAPGELGMVASQRPDLRADDQPTQRREGSLVDRHFAVAQGRHHRTQLVGPARLGRLLGIGGSPLWRQHQVNPWRSMSTGTAATISIPASRRR